MSKNKTIKFFISSTFKDFLKERNALQNLVFPRLKKLCNSKGFSFQPVDLRWGITEKSSEDNKTMLYCLNEVKRCSSEPKPNLLILLGQRYGWGPLPIYINPEIFIDDILKEIKDYDFLEDDFPKAIKNWKKEIKEENDKKKKEKLQKSLKEAKNYEFKNITIKGLLKEWYIQDRNDKEEKYFLKDKKKVPDYIWRFIEKTLKNSIQKIEKTKSDTDLYSQFHTSATEQEIIYAFNEQDKVNSDNIIVYQREFTYGEDEELIESLDKAQEKLKNLKTFLTKDKKEITSIPNKSIDVNTYNELENEYFSDDKETYEYPQNMPNYLKNFCNDIYYEFAKRIEDEIKNFGKKSSLEIDLKEQENFLKLKSKTIGRTTEIDTIKDFVIKNSEDKFYLLYGKSGIGKTSVMASAISELKDENVIYRFIGTTAHTTSPRDTYEHIYWEIVDKNIDDKLKLNIELDNQKFYKQFYKALEDYGEKLTIFIDAVDQFNDFDSLEIFLNYVPDNVKVVFSCLYDETKTDKKDYTFYYNQLKHLQNKDELKELKDSNKEILNIWLTENNRILQEKQENLILEYAKGKTPLYLRLAFEIAKEWKSQDNIDELKSELGESEKELIKSFFKNIIKKHDVKDKLLSLTLGFISASKDGLSESEIIDILSMDKEILEMYERKNSSYPKLSALPASIFSKMYYHMQDIFTERNIDGEMLINPYHRIVEELIHEEYYKEEYHANLADYFYTVQDNKKTWDKRYYNIHMLSEYPYQLLYSKNSDKLKKILFDLEFAGSVYNNKKQKSFRDVMSKATSLISEEEIYPWESFYREKEHLILKVDEELWRPHQSLFQLAYEDGLDSPLTDKANELLNEEDRKPIDWKWLKIKSIKSFSYRNNLVKMMELKKVIKDDILRSKFIFDNSKFGILNENLFYEISKDFNIRTFYKVNDYEEEKDNLKEFYKKNNSLSDKIPWNETSIRYIEFNDKTIVIIRKKYNYIFSSKTNKTLDDSDYLFKNIIKLNEEFFLTSNFNNFSDKSNNRIILWDKMLVKHDIYDMFTDRIDKIKTIGKYILISSFDKTVRILSLNIEKKVLEEKKIIFMSNIHKIDDISFFNEDYIAILSNQTIYFYLITNQHLKEETPVIDYIINESSNPNLLISKNKVYEYNNNKLIIWEDQENDDVISFFIKISKNSLITFSKSGHITWWQNKKVIFNQKINTDEIINVKKIDNENFFIVNSDSVLIFNILKVYEEKNFYPILKISESNSIKECLYFTQNKKDYFVLLSGMKLFVYEVTNNSYEIKNEFELKNYNYYLKQITDNSLIIYENFSMKESENLKLLHLDELLLKKDIHANINLNSVEILINVNEDFFIGFVNEVIVILDIEGNVLKSYKDFSIRKDIKIKIINNDMFLVISEQKFIFLDFNLDIQGICYFISNNKLVLTDYYKINNNFIIADGNTIGEYSLSPIFTDKENLINVDEEYLLDNLLNDVKKNEILKDILKTNLLTILEKIGNNDDEIKKIFEKYLKIKFEDDNLYEELSNLSIEDFENVKVNKSIDDVEDYLSSYSV